MNQLLSQIWTLQDKVISLNEAKEFSRPGDSEQLWNVPRSQSTLENSESQRYAQPRFWIAALHTELDGYFRKCFFKIHLFQKQYPISTRNFHETWRKSETRTAEFTNTDSTIFQES